MLKLMTTLVQLDPHAYERVRPLFAALRYNLVVDSIIDGYTPAWIFVDRRESPRSALMWNRQDAMLIAGEAGSTAFNRAAHDVITTRIVPDARKRYIPELTLHYGDDAWRAQSDIILRGLAAEPAGRLCYHFDRLKVDWRARMAPGLSMRRMDRALLAQRDLVHIEHARGWVGSFWRSIEDFVEHSFGYALLKRLPDSAACGVVSWCLAVYVSGANYELGLATMPEHRRQGYATLVAAASVEQALARDAAPHWHCWADNAGSRATAERVGFADPAPYTVLRIEL
jgi:GNAT superfamily N-acetyltransferase